ncbi:hypothetical protein NC652_006768 [Populus alba x Populus x berolinensis]|nr:hypothetical protein NC652_006768 [Populus alba x Populus x berolinensis]
MFGLGLSHYHRVTVKRKQKRSVEAGYGHRGAAVEYTFLPCMLYAGRNLTRSSHGRLVPPSMSESIPSRTVGPGGMSVWYCC